LIFQPPTKKSKSCFDEPALGVMANFPSGEMEYIAGIVTPFVRLFPSHTASSAQQLAHASVGDAKIRTSTAVWTLGQGFRTKRRVRA
jgi:hypothetical protein